MEICFGWHLYFVYLTAYTPIMRQRSKNIIFLYALLLISVTFCGAQTTLPDSLRTLISNSKDQAQKLKAYKALGSYYALKDFDSSSLFAQAGMSLASELKDSLSWAMMITTLGEAEYFRGNYQK